MRIIKKTRGVGDLDKLKKDLDILYSQTQAVLGYPKVSKREVSIDYAINKIVPKLKIYIPQYNQLVKSLVYTYLIEKKSIDSETSFLAALQIGLDTLESFCSWYVPEIIDYRIYL